MHFMEHALASCQTDARSIARPDGIWYVCGSTQQAASYTLTVPSNCMSWKSFCTQRTCCAVASIPVLQGHVVMSNGLCLILSSSKAVLTAGVTHLSTWQSVLGPSRLQSSPVRYHNPPLGVVAHTLKIQQLLKWSNSSLLCQSSQPCTGVWSWKLLLMWLNAGCDWWQPDGSERPAASATVWGSVRSSVVPMRHSARPNTEAHTDQCKA